MNLRGVFFLLGRLLLVLSVALLIPAAVAYFSDGRIELVAFLMSAGVAAAAGISLERKFVQRQEFSFGRNEAFVLVASAWVVATMVGTLPYVFIKGPSFIVNGIFESVSGFTTTGASILPDVESEPNSILLWRALTQWLGGMGIIVLGIAVLPKLAIGGMELLGAEAPGPIKEKLTPRLAQTGKALWGIYMLFTAAEVLILRSLGLGLFDAVAHSFATMATGGFSTRNASIAAFDNPAVEMTVVLFMLLAGASFTLHFHWIRGRARPLLRDPEFRLYIGIVAVGALLITSDLLLQRTYGGVGSAIRFAIFQASTIVTTTGFATADFDAWPDFSRAMLFVMMFVGGCAGIHGWLGEGRTDPHRRQEGGGRSATHGSAARDAASAGGSQGCPRGCRLRSHHLLPALPCFVHRGWAAAHADGDGSAVGLFRVRRMFGEHRARIRSGRADDELRGATGAGEAATCLDDDRGTARALYDPCAFFS